jgi:hypothetical protein
MIGFGASPSRSSLKGAAVTRPLLLLVATGAICVASLSFAATDCVGTLTGQWVTKGDLDIGVAEVKLDNHHSFNADGSFKAIGRFVNQQGKWEEQTFSGKWSTKPGEGANECVLEMSSSSELGMMNSSTIVTIVDGNTFRSFGLDAKRVK